MANTPADRSEKHVCVATTGREQLGPNNAIRYRHPASGSRAHRGHSADGSASAKARATIRRLLVARFWSRLMRRTMPLQILWCGTAFTFPGARVELAAGGKLAVRHQACGALNELVCYGSSEDGRELYKVVGEVRSVRWLGISATCRQHDDWSRVSLSCLIGRALLTPTSRVSGAFARLICTPRTEQPPQRPVVSTRHCKVAVGWY
jgi:hypothetical protein